MAVVVEGANANPGCAATTPARLLGLIALAIVLLLQISCVVLPVRVASGVSGTVVDRSSGKPLSDALVVVRFEGHYDDVLPDRALLGHREGKTDAAGRFSIGAIVRPGLSVWPAYQTEARVVAVLKDGYRCASPRQLGAAGNPVGDGDDVQIRLDATVDSYAQRQTCRPVAAARGDAVEYMAAWRALYPATDSGRDTDRVEINRVLAARSTFGFGQNCRGPVLDLALAPDGRRAAIAVVGADSASVRILELQGSRSEVAVSHEMRSDLDRLAWTKSGDLVLWEPAPISQQLMSPSGFSPGRFEQIWSATGPAKQAPDASRIEPSSALDPMNWTDESDARWMGRSFLLDQSPDPETGLSSDELRVHRDDGSIYTLALPGEPCGTPGRFGRPHYRIAADGRSSLDLRFVEGGCHVVQTDLESGKWTAIDAVDEPGVCSSSRRVPATHFAAALRGYVRDIESIAESSGADPSAAYALRIGPGGTQLDTRDFHGEILTVGVPRFPISTPLRRIEVSVVGSAPRVHATGSELEPL